MERGSVVLVFGESRNDSESVRYLTASNNPSLPLGLIKALPRPTSLQRSAGGPVVRKWVDEIARVVKGFEATGQRVAAILVHRDADGPDPDQHVHHELMQQIGPVGRGCAVVPVEEIEAWWFLFPDAVEAVRPRTWRGRMPRRARDVEKIHNPKEELIKLTQRQRAAAYSESDSVTVARTVYERALSPLGTSVSYARFQSDAGAIR